MLTNLTIQGLAIIESLNIEFAHGFNIITGETGAGKSILIKALGLLLGSKTSADAVRSGFEQATVSGRFVVKPNHPGLKLLADWGVATEEDEHGRAVIIRRQVTAKGRTSAWINDVPVTLTSLKELAESLIDVFGQHDNHRLLDVAFHSIYLDQFIKTKDLPLRLEQKWREASHVIGELRTFVDELRGRGRDVDYLVFRLNELNDFAPTDEDFRNVSDVTERAKSSMAISTAIQRAASALEDEGGVTLAKRLREVTKALAGPKLTALDELGQQAAKIAESLDDLSFDLGKAAEAIDVSEEDVDRAEARVAGYQALLRKHGTSDLEGLKLEWDKLAAQVHAIENASAHVKKLLDLLEATKDDVLVLSKHLSSERINAVDIICKRVEQELEDLAMPAARFAVELEPIVKPAAALDLSSFDDSIKSRWANIMDDWTSVNSHGSERAQFFLASNAGEPSLPLAKVASGGEISRIMLALKKALVVGAETCVLVFDEIDTGISGRIADTVGKKIAELADFCQIICISHLPQVSAYADTHYIVEKKQKGTRTESNMRALSDGERYEEIARLLSGNKITAQSLAHAKNLVIEAHNKVRPKKSQKISAIEKSPAVAATKRRT